MVSNPAIPVFVFAREEDGMFRRSFSPCSYFALFKLGRWRRRELEHYRLRIRVALVAPICQLRENSNDPSGNNRISNDSSAIDQFRVPSPTK